MKQISPTNVGRVASENRDLLYIRLIASDVPAEVLAQLDPGEQALEAMVGMRDDLTVELQQKLINAARDLLNQMEATLRGGVGARPGKKAVKA